MVVVFPIRFLRPRHRHDTSYCFIFCYKEAGRPELNDLAERTRETSGIGTHRRLKLATRPDSGFCQENKRLSYSSNIFAIKDLSDQVSLIVVM